MVKQALLISAAVLAFAAPASWAGTKILWDVGLPSATETRDYVLGFFSKAIQFLAVNGVESDFGTGDFRPEMMKGYQALISASVAPYRSYNPEQVKGILEFSERCGAIVVSECPGWMMGRPLVIPVLDQLGIQIHVDTYPGTYRARKADGEPLFQGVGDMTYADAGTLSVPQGAKAFLFTSSGSVGGPDLPLAVSASEGHVLALGDTDLISNGATEENYKFLLNAVRKLASKCEADLPVIGD